MELTQVIENVILTKACSIKPDGESNESKTINVKMDYSGLTLRDIFTKALSSDVIKWQASARKRFDTFEDKQTVEVSAKSPGGSPQIDPETAMVNKLKSMDAEAQTQYLKDMLAKVKLSQEKYNIKHEESKETLIK